MKSPLVSFGPLAVCVVLIGSAIVVPSAGAQSLTIEVPVDKFISGEPGSTQYIESVEVDESDYGHVCDIELLARNSLSIHEGNDLLVTSGDSQIVFAGIEDEAQQVEPLTAEITLAGPILLELRLGEDGKSSMGFVSTFDCEAEPVVESAATVSVPAVSTTVETELDLTEVTKIDTGNVEAETTITVAAPDVTVAGITTDKAVGVPTIDEVLVELPNVPKAEAIVAKPTYTG